MGQGFWDILGEISTVTGLAGSGFALGAWIQAGVISRNVRQEKERLDHEIQFELQGENNRHVIQLPFGLRRRELTRSELLGLIGMLPMKKPGGRFEIRFLSTPTFRELLSRMQDGEEEMLMSIPCTDREIEQFDV